MDENGWIRECDVSTYGVVVTNHAWDLRAYCPEVSGDGPEAITFVPNEWLQREGFRNGSGQLYIGTNGMGGLMFVGSQIGGYVHVFDLRTNANTFTYVGSNLTSRAETADLEFDRATGKLYIWHNPGSESNFLEVAELNSTVSNGFRRLHTLIEYAGPRTGNLEGFGLAHNPGTDDWCLVTDDSNDNSEGVMLYRQFRPVTDTDNDGLADDWELRYFGSCSISDGTADHDGDGQTDFQEFLVGTDPTSGQSQFRVVSLTSDGADINIEWQTAGGHTNIVQVAAPPAGDYDTNAFTDLSPPLTMAGTGDVLTNFVDTGGATNEPSRFYRVRTVP